MSIASEITNYANGLSDAYNAVNDMQGIIPTDKNMNNLDTAIRTIPQSQGATYTAGNGINIDANNEISIDDTVVAELSDLPTDFTGATSSTAGANGLVPGPLAGDEDKYLKADGTWATVQAGATYTAGSHISIDQNNEISATYSDFVGSDGVNNGVEGLVPAPNFDDVNKYLKGDGTWAEIATPTIEYYTTEELNTLWEAA